MKNSLERWPTLPIVVRYGGSLEPDPPTSEDEDDIVAALKQSDRVISVSITITSSLLEKLSAIERPLSELQELDLLSPVTPWPTLPNTFQWGPHLRGLYSTEIAFPPLLQLIYSSINLVDLRLHEVLDPLHFSPEALTNALSGMAQLRFLSLHFGLLSTTYCPPSLPLSEERVVLPALTCFEFRGHTQYLESLVSRVDAPCLEDIAITFFDHPILSVSMLNKFINRIEMHRLHRQAHIILLEHSISISLLQPGVPTRRLTLRLICQPIYKQISLMTEFCLSFSSVLINVGELYINPLRNLKRRDRFYSQQLMELLSSFTGVKGFHDINADDSNSDSTNVVHALQLPERQRESVLPALSKLFIQQPGPRHAPLREAVVKFMVSYRLRGHCIQVEYEPACDINEQRDAGTL